MGCSAQSLTPTGPGLAKQQSKGMTPCVLLAVQLSLYSQFWRWPLSLQNPRATHVWFSRPVASGTFT